MRYKFLFSLALNLLFLEAIGQTNEVSLVVSSKGTTEEEARTNALRSAIEQAFGTFVSSRTEILNDNLVQDQIVSLSNGNIKKFEVLSSLFLTEQNLHLVTLNATVSLDKLTSFVQSKGYNDVSFDGGGFTMNLKIQRLNESAELIAVTNLLEQGIDLCDGFFDRTLEVGQPLLNSQAGSPLTYRIPLKVDVKLNENWENFYEYYRKTLKNISMLGADIATYTQMNKSIYQLVLMESSVEKYTPRSAYGGSTVKAEREVNKATDTLYFRNYDVFALIASSQILMNAKYFNDFKIYHNLDTLNIEFDYLAKYKLVEQNWNFKVNDENSNIWVYTFMPFDSFTGFNQYGEPEWSLRLSYNLRPFYTFTDDRNRWLIDYRPWDNDIQFYGALNSNINKRPLMSLSSLIIEGNMPGNWGEFLRRKNDNERKRMFVVKPPIGKSFIVGISPSFIEKELEQLKGFKLLN